MLGTPRRGADRASRLWVYPRVRSAWRDPSPEACAEPVIGRAFARPVGSGFDLSPAGRGKNVHPRN
jgi:hypothetical protein